MDEWFRSDAACRDYIRRLRWPDGFLCPECGVAADPWGMSRGRLRCRACEWETSLTAGTVFQDTRKPLRMWFLAMWFVTSQKNGVSALGLQRALGLGSYETAWTWLHKLRRAMVRPGRDCLTGMVEVDETYVGGPEEGKHGRGAEAKTIVAVAAEKSGRAIGRIRLRRIKDVSADSLLPFVQSVGGAGVGSPHRRMARVFRAGERWLPAPDHRHQRRFGSSPRSHAAGSHCRLASQAVASRHSPGRHPATTPRLLPRRIHFSVQPATLECSRVAVPQARPAGDCGRARALQFDCRSHPDEEINLTGVINGCEGDTHLSKNGAAKRPSV